MIWGMSTSDSTATLARPWTRHRRVRSGQVALHVVEAGDGSHPTVVLVHGFPDTSTLWNQVASTLADQFHVVAYDVRGAGRSTRPGRVRDHAMPRLMADLRAVVGATSDGRVHLVGHDWGAIQAWDAATDPAMAPMVASFTAVSAPSFDLTGHWIRHHLPRGVGALADQGRRSWYMAAFQVPGIAPLVWRAGLAANWTRLRAAVEGRDDLQAPDATLVDDAVHGILLYRANARRLVRPVRSQVHVPVRVLTGEHDPFVSPRLYDLLGDHDVDVEMLPGGRHWLPLTHPDRVADAIARHVRAVEDASRISRRVGRSGRD